MFGVEQKFDNDTVDGPNGGEGLFHFVDGADEEYEYSYDENGNMTKDLNRGIEEIRYNFLNLPSEISFTEKNAYIRNMYDANGHKFKMITYANVPLVIGEGSSGKGQCQGSHCSHLSRIQHIQICANQQIPAAACCLYGIAVS